MVYMGSKRKYAKYIVPILQKLIDENGIRTYIEPFVGGANIIDKIKCENKFGYDKNSTLIALHQQGQKDLASIPEHGDPDWWYEAKEIYKTSFGNPKEDKMPLWKIGAIQFFASYSRGGFSRGYVKNSAQRDYYNEAFKNFYTQAQQPLYKDIKFEVKDFFDLNISNALIYCDPPYEGTKPYGYKFETSFDYNKYWDKIRELSKNNIVICSEQNFPEDFEILWEQEVTRTTNKKNNFKATEKLGYCKKGEKYEIKRS